MKKNKLYQTLIVLILPVMAVMAGVLMTEFFWQLLSKNQNNIETRKFSLYSSDKNNVFRNIHSFFVYEKNAKIKSSAYILTNDFVKEYDYTILTNNFGLVQNKNIYPGIPSLLTLGDSFTEGQGALAWFENLASERLPNIPQYINGGIMGTGFQQWELLHEHLIKNKILVKYLVVIFISDDYKRTTWNMSPKILECINNYLKCEGDEYFYGMPKNENDLKKFLGKLNDSRIEMMKKSTFKFVDAIEKYLPATLSVLRYIENMILDVESHESLRHNRDAILKLSNTYGENIIYIHLPQKEEISNRRISNLGIEARNEILKAGSTLFDGFKECSLSIEDYFMNDPHPNEIGYQKISACVGKLIKRKWGEVK
ncbi:hypothetical protein CL55_00003170 [Polynucleobacter duraquae]|uniref:GDSL-like Lipase/Acylhydrolase n=1 Tax=Polynucleobacter duraquae TaxID=1835254 RepID=A0A0E3ZK45_9BURK|nr:hypothetical protein [Polynucleobacter duraquae]AKD24650.1 hypothetical protein CL55_00003170 [Polynucleobacter duraquae]